MNLDQFKISKGMGGNVLLGKVNKAGNIYLHKKDITEMFTSVALEVFEGQEVLQAFELPNGEVKVYTLRCTKQVMSRKAFDELMAERESR